MDSKLKRYLSNWQDEVDSAAQYRAIADLEKDPNIKKVFESLYETEARHASFWETQIRKLGVPVRDRRPSWRARTLIRFARWFGSRLILGTIAQNEMVNRNQYGPQQETHGTGMTHEERFHAELLSRLALSQPKGVTGGVLGRIEGRHKTMGSNALRAAVLGANDGLCSNLSLVMGVAGATFDDHVLLLTGVAGLLAGGFSMAIGEWLSVTSARELAEREIQVEADEVALDPQSEAEELRLIYEAKGLSPEEAKRLSQHMMSDSARALDALAREELGIDPHELAGSPIQAALVSFFLFAAGAFIPLSPFLFLSGSTAVIASLALSALALFGTGTLITLFTGRSIWISGSRQLLLGGFAAALTYSLGHLAGAVL